MFQRLRNVSTAALLLAFAHAVSCSPPPEDDDNGDFGGSGNVDGNSGGTSANGSNGSGTSGSGTNSTSGSSQGSGSGSGGSSSGSTSGSSGNSGNNSSSSSSSGGPVFGGSDAVACPGLPVGEGLDEDEICTGTGYEAEVLPVDLLLMVDTSTSMVDNEYNGVTRWELVSNAVKDFVEDPGAQEIGMGIHFWSWVDDSSCDVDNYSTPTVPIGPLSENGEDIIAAIDDQRPGGLTPTYPALQGAIEYAKSYAADNRTRQAVVVFVTDGYPTRCDPMDIPSIASLASDSWAETPNVPVFVVGIDGTYNLDQIAQQGGTREAFDVQNDGSTERLVTQLKNITTDEARCEFEIPVPPGSDYQSVDTELVQVIYTPNEGDQQEIPKVAGYSACQMSENGGWYFGGQDANGRPTKIVVCPCSCANFGAGQVEVALGCKPSGPIL